MREFKLDYYYHPEARATYDDLYGIHQDDVDRRVDFLCLHPEPDDEITFAWPEQGPDMFIFYDDAWLITYGLEDDASVLVVWLMVPAGRLRPGG